MLRKIVSIENVGRFLSYGAVGDVQLKRYNLIFAENGRGKTTLCALLRSLGSGEAAHVLGRATLGSGGGPEIKVLLDSGTAAFSNGAWSATAPDLAIFDSTFVYDNVYSGDAVDLDHKRRLYKMIVGKQGVDLARQIEDLDRATRGKSTEIREKRAVVEGRVPQGLTVDAFLALQGDAGIDAKIADTERELEAAKQAFWIKIRAALSELAPPTFPAAFEGLLGRTIEGIAEDVGRRIASQIEAHAMHERGEPWLSEGLGYIRNDACPFCGRSLDGVVLIAAYKAYFSEAYNALRTEITAMRHVIDTVFGDREIARIDTILTQNTAAVEFWSRYCAITPPTLDGVDRIGDTLRAVRQAALALLDRKAATPVDRVSADASFTAAHAALMGVQNDLAIYNQAVRAANTDIEAKRVATGAADVGTVESALTRLRATKKRHEPDTRAVCQEYETALAEKRASENQKANTKTALDEYTQEVIGPYEKTINRLLDDFQAGFRIAGTEHGYPGGVASSSYQIVINDTPVEIGDSNTPP